MWGSQRQVLPGAGSAWPFPQKSYTGSLQWASVLVQLTHFA